MRYWLFNSYPIVNNPYKKRVYRYNVVDYHIFLKGEIFHMKNKALAPIFLTVLLGSSYVYAESNDSVAMETTTKEEHGVETEMEEPKVAKERGVDSETMELNPVELESAKDQIPYSEAIEALEPFNQTLVDISDKTWDKIHNLQEKGKKKRLIIYQMLGKNVKKNYLVL